MQVLLRVSLLAAVLFGFQPLQAATCRDPEGFDAFLAAIVQEAAAQGVSKSALAALDGLDYDPTIITKDQNQKVFRQSFEEFSARMISPYRLRKGAQLMKQYASVFSRVEAAYGVPAPVIVAIWGLETDFGAVNGSTPTLRALATLAFDCRRTERFQAELIDALKLIDRGDLAVAAMRGAWAGELGQTQFMPSSYLKYAVDFDGNGRADLINNVPDVLASTANYLQGSGWQPGAGWEPGQPNFAAIKEWNKADVYARTIAAFATKLAAAK